MRFVTLIGFVVGMCARISAPRADCAPDTSKPRKDRLEVTFLGQFEDLLGHRASFFFDEARDLVIGPVDHDVWPGTKRRAIALAKGVTPGAKGTLTITWLAQPGQQVTGGGYFDSFAASKARGSIDTLVTKIADPFVLGLLAPTNPKADAKLGPWRADAQFRDELMQATVGVLYAARGTRAQTLLTTIGYRDVAGARLDRIAVLRDGGLAAVAKLTQDRNKSDWTDYLPELAAAWSNKKDVTAVLDDLLLGADTPSIPIEVENPFRRGCGPSRKDLRGPFASSDELTPITLRDLVRKTDKRFATTVEAAFKAASAGSDAYVAAMRGATAILVSNGNYTAISPGKPLPLGARVRYVARSSDRDAQFAIGHLEDNESPVTDAGKLSRFDARSADVNKLLEVLKFQMRSGSSPVFGGMAIALLFELADRVPGWTLADARSYAWSLPGNEYDQPREWAATWSELLVHAIRYAPDDKLTTEVERALPTIVGQFARRHGGKRTAKLPAEIVRNFGVQIATEIVVRRLMANDLPGAQRIVELAGGPVSAIAGTTPVERETTQDSNYALQLVTLRVLVGTLRGQAVKLPPSEHRSHGLALFDYYTRPYRSNVRAPWRKALIDAGYPARP